MSRYWKVFLVLPAFFIALGLLYLSQVPSYLLQIWVDPRPGIEMRRDKMVAISNGKEPIFYDIGGDVTPSISRVSLRIRRQDEPDFEKPLDINVSRGSFLGTVKLGSAEKPITSDENYTYEIEDANGKSRLSDGAIHIQVKAISGTSPWVMITLGGIGLLASFLQILQFFTQRRSWRNQEKTPESVKHEVIEG